MTTAAPFLLSEVPPWLSLPFGITMLLLGAEWLVDGAVRVARGLGVSTLVIGLTVVAFGTSAPELAVNLIAALNDHGELGFGNVVGSNIANIGLVVAIGALARPIAVHSRVISLELPWLLMVSALMVGLAVPLFTEEGRGYERSDGLLLVTIFAATMWLWHRLGRRDASDPLVQELAGEAKEHKPDALGTAIAIFLIGLVLLVIGGKLTEAGAVDVARAIGLSDAVIGMTVVAVATSLPELFTVVVAARKNHADLAVGNVVGSNMFNILLVLGVTAAVAEVPLPRGAHGWWDLGVMLALTVVLYAVTLTRNRMITRWEGALLLACYLGFMSFRVGSELS